MNSINHYINKIICGDALEVLKEMPGESVNCCVCSPPYWNLRDYGEEGQLGLEKTFEEYITKLCDIFDEVKRVLRKDGTCWVNLGDSYGGSGNRSGHTLETSNLNRLTIGYGATEGNQKATKGYEKCLLDIPYRFSIEMTNRGWIKRNTIIWWKPGCMPSSASDRFTVDFEYLFYFTKNNKTIFWINEKTLECIDKKPLGTKGIEGKDWEWRPCLACSDKDYFNYRTRDVMKKEKGCPQFKASNEEKENIKNKICPRCKGLKKVKYSLWTGHDYWFEQQFENWTDDRPNDLKRAIEGHKKYRGKYLDKSKKGSFAFDEAKIVGNPRQGRNKRCVWTIPTNPFPEAHFAVYPEGLIGIPIKAGCPEFICKKCGKARVKILDITKPPEEVYTKSNLPNDGFIKSGIRRNGKFKGSGQKVQNWKNQNTNKFLGYTDCGCNAGWESGIVLDPFMGAGTSALVALKQRKRFIGIEIKQEYIDMANKRIAKVQQELI